MLTVESENFVKFNNKLSEVTVEIFVDTADELPEIDGISGKILHQGSRAYVVKSGEFYVLSGDRKWYDTAGKEAVK